MPNVETGLTAWERGGAIGLALIALASFVIPAFGVLVWIIKTNRADRKAAAKDRKDEIAAAAKERREENERMEKRLDRIIDAHINSMNKLGEKLGDNVIKALDGINSNINAIHTRFDNHIGGRTMEDRDG